MKPRHLVISLLAFLPCISATANSKPGPCTPHRIPENCAILAASDWVQEILARRQAMQEACFSAETPSSEEDRRFFEAQCQAARERYEPSRTCANALSVALAHCEAF